MFLRDRFSRSPRSASSCRITIEFVIGYLSKRSIIFIKYLIRVAINSALTRYNYRGINNYARGEDRNTELVVDQRSINFILLYEYRSGYPLIYGYISCPTHSQLISRINREAATRGVLARYKHEYYILSESNANATVYVTATPGAEG